MDGSVGSGSPGSAPWHAVCGTDPVVSATYRRRTPEETLLHEVVRDNLATFFDWAEVRSPDSRGLPRYVKRAFERYLD